MAKSVVFRGKIRRKAKSKIRSFRKKLWANHKKNARARRQERKGAREARRTVASTKQDARPQTPFLARHPLLADVKDGLAVRAHAVLDRRDLRSGVITQEELEALSNYSSQEQWRVAMLDRRRQSYREQRALNRDSDYGPLTMVYGRASKGGLAEVRHVGFRPPPPRQTVLKPSGPPSWSPPNRRPVRRKRKDRVGQIVHEWKPQLTKNARNAMASDGNLSGALQAVHSFAEQYPESRSQIHDHLGKMAEFGKGYADAMETFLSTLRNGKGDDNPGLPPEVVQHLQPLTDVGEVIERACQATVAAWEDYFADAIRVAQDEHTPSKAALTS